MHSVPPLGQRDVAVVGARHPGLPARVPAIGRQDGAILRHGPPPAYGRGVVGGV